MIVRCPFCSYSKADVSPGKYCCSRCREKFIVSGFHEIQDSQGRPVYRKSIFHSFIKALLLRYAPIILFTAVMLFTLNINMDISISLSAAAVVFIIALIFYLVYMDGIWSCPNCEKPLPAGSKGSPRYRVFCDHCGMQLRKSIFWK